MHKYTIEFLDIVPNAVLEELARHNLVDITKMYVVGRIMSPIEKEVRATLLNQHIWKVRTRMPDIVNKVFEAFTYENVNLHDTIYYKILQKERIG